MQSRVLFSAIFLALILALALCAINASRHYKALGAAVARLDIALIPPILGNCIIVGSHTRTLSLVGYYVFFIGMNYMIFELIRFTRAYCNQSGIGKKLPNWLSFLLLGDSVLLLANIVTGHAFSVEEMILDGKTYYSLVPFWGQAIHRIVTYGLYNLVVVVFLISMINASKIYRERYSVIL